MSDEKILLAESELASLERLYTNVRDSDVLFILQLFTKPMSQWVSTKMGLTDTKGNILRKPKNDMERRILSPFFVMLLSLYNDLMPAARARNWAGYQTAYARIFLKNLRESEGGGDGAGTAALTTANVATLPGTLGVVKRTPPKEVTKRISKKKMKQLKDGEDINKVVGDLIEEARGRGDRYLIVTDGSAYHKMRVS